MWRGPPMEKTVAELFAGVGGFRVGLNKVKRCKKNGEAIENGPWTFVWANQWEPATHTQDAFDCYVKHFGKESNSNEDISIVNKNNIPDHNLLVGGFPCQDYSVARSLSHEKGIEGKKGVLWWQINDILLAKKPKFVLLENVDRLLKAPSKQRGQAFGIMLRCFAEAGYGVQWRVINAADYGHVQRRRRVFIFAFHQSTQYFNDFMAQSQAETTENLLVHNCMFSIPFPAKKISEPLHGNVIDEKKYVSLVDVSEKFAADFENSGYCLNGKYWTMKVKSTSRRRHVTLRKILDCTNVPDYCYDVNIEKFKYLKGRKHIPRRAKNGYEYIYSEGAISFPDRLDSSGRTMLTSEATTNRSSHLILDPISHRYRVLTPVECERMDEFPDNWTNIGMTPRKRYFIAGNALVCGLINSMGGEISEIIDKEP
jgi:DNA (cytosine-5)-methyltransferase 1